MAEDDTTLEIKGLNQILKALKAKPPIARVGILGSKDSRSGKVNSNATIGAAHEFGTSKLPQRSFLRVPLFNNLNKQLAASHAFDKDVLNEAIKSGSVLPWLKKITAIAEAIVLEAFDQQGPGWAAWKGKYVSKSGMILNNSGQLKSSISSEVKA